MRNLLVAQSGGPTAAINATVAGVLTAASLSGEVDQVLGAVNGIKGVLEERFVNLSDVMNNTADLDLLCQTPAAALGSCRFKLSDPQENPEQYEEIIRIFEKHEISYFIYIGGNDSMDTVDKLSAYCREKNIGDICIVGAPKTIDNDLMGTDHCPGFGSAAKYIGSTFAELERDCSVYDTKAVTIVEVMGRNAGWLTASSALARNNGGKGPSLIYLCERPFSIPQFLKDVREKLAVQDSVLVAVSEGIRDARGVYISESVQSGAVDNFGHSYIAGSARVLEDAVRQEIGCKVPHAIVKGGDTRFFSVKNGLDWLLAERRRKGEEDSGLSLVAVHDGVRPFVSPEVVEACFDKAAVTGAVIPVVPMIDSLRETDGKGSHPVDRSRYMAVQTPQVFHLELLTKAYEQPYSSLFTDDASVVEAMGHAIDTVPGDRENIKITTPFDLLIAEAMFAR